MAEGAVRAGYIVYTIDCFADADTHELANAVYQLETSASETEIRTILDAIGPVDCVVMGSGFEHYRCLVKKILGCPVFLNSAKIFKQLNDPTVFFAMLDRLAISHPGHLFKAGNESENLLLKRAGGCGGQQVRQFRHAQVSLNKGEYLQRKVSGETISATFIADGHSFLLLGCNRNWQERTNQHPCLFAGAVRIDDKQWRHRKEVIGILSRLMSELKLKGLCGIDFILENEQLLLIDVNARPVQTAGLYMAEYENMFQHHLDSFSGVLPAERTLIGSYAQKIVYAKTTLKIPEHCKWPEWVKDRPMQGSLIEAGSPVCSILANAENELETIKLIENRETTLRQQIASYN